MNTNRNEAEARQIETEKDRKEGEWVRKRVFDSNRGEERGGRKVPDYTVPCTGFFHPVAWVIWNGFCNILV
jgi:hypothetical protein